MDRRTFLQQTAAGATIPWLMPPANSSAIKRLDKIGVQLFSLPKKLETNFEQAIAMLANLGYKEVELYGPYPFSTQTAQERWKKVTPSLGFSGSGFFGRTVGQIGDILTRHGISAPSLHTDLDTLQTGMGKLAEAAHALRSQYVTLPSIPDQYRRTLDDYRRMADTFNKIGESAKKAGVTFAYHNHGYGLAEMDRQVPLKVLLDRTQPDLVALEMDVYWTTAGGADPIAYLQAYPKQYRMMHLKDMAKAVRFSGDGGDSKQWIELFPYMTTAGSGILNLPAIVAKAQQVGVKHFIVEQDMFASPETALKKSFDYLASLS